MTASIQVEANIMAKAWRKSVFSKFFAGCWYLEQWNFPIGRAEKPCTALTIDVEQMGRGFRHRKVGQERRKEGHALIAEGPCLTKGSGKEEGNMLHSREIPQSGGHTIYRREGPKFLRALWPKPKEPSKMVKELRQRTTHRCVYHFIYWSMLPMLAKEQLSLWTLTISVSVFNYCSWKGIQSSNKDQVRNAGLEAKKAKCQAEERDWIGTQANL